ncbi:MAG: nuclear transport factor 2 family protein [Actinomycetota bacterium]
MPTPHDRDVTDATRAVIRRYEHDLYNARNLDLVEELLSDPMYRHDAGGDITEMSNADCRARIGGFFRDFELLEFTTVHLVVEGTLASWTYKLNGTANDGSQTVLSSIEVFEIIDGKITRVWNAAHTPGPWG